MMFVAQIKISRNAIPWEYLFSTEEEARELCERKEQHNPFVRWTQVLKGSPEYPDSGQIIDRI